MFVMNNILVFPGLDNLIFNKIDAQLIISITLLIQDDQLECQINPDFSG